MFNRREWYDMSEIRQSDIFVFLTDKKLFRNPSYTQLYIATKLNVLKGGTGNKISDIIRGKDDGLENLKPDDIYVQFFMPMENDGEHFRRLKNAVKNGIKPRKGRKERKGPLTLALLSFRLWTITKKSLISTVKWRVRPHLESIPELTLL